VLSTLPVYPAPLTHQLPKPDKPCASRRASVWTVSWCLTTRGHVGVPADGRSEDRALGGRMRTCKLEEIALDDALRVCRAEQQQTRKSDQPRPAASKRDAGDDQPGSDWQREEQDGH
jgi:hypothetical protein